MKSRLSIILFLAGLTALFIIQNVATVEIQFLFWSTQMPRSILMFLLLAIGIAIGWFLHSHFRHLKKVRNKD